MSDSIGAIEINTCGQLNRPDMSLLSLYYHVSGQSSSTNEIACYFILMNIHKNGHMVENELGEFLTWWNHLPNFIRVD